MDRALVEAKLESLRRCVERIATKTPTSADQLAQNPDLQDIIALNLQRAVQLSVDLASHLIAETDARPPSTMAENFEALKNLQLISPALSERMTKAVGFRNVAVHSYKLSIGTSSIRSAATTSTTSDSSPRQLPNDLPPANVNGQTLLLRSQGEGVCSVSHCAYPFVRTFSSMPNQARA